MKNENLWVWDLSFVFFTIDLVENFDEASKNEANWLPTPALWMGLQFQVVARRFSVFNLDERGIISTLSSKPETFVLWTRSPDPRYPLQNGLMHLK